MKFSYKNIFYLILFLALLSRVYIVFFSGLPWYGPDTGNYIKMARAIIDGNPISFFPNGFPLLLAGTILVSPDHFTLILVILNILMQTGAIILIEKIMVKYNVEWKTRLLIIFIISFYPHLMNNVRLVLTESVSLFLIALSLLFYDSGKYSMSGFFGYLTCTFRPSLVLVFPLLIIYDLLRKKKTPALNTSAGFLTGLILFLCLEWTGLVAAPNNYEYNAVLAVNSYGNNINFKLTGVDNYEIHHPVKTYFNFMVNHPGQYIKQRFLSLWNLWGPLTYTGFSIKSFMLHVVRFPLFILALLAFLYRKIMNYKPDLILLISLPVISITMIHFFFISTSRHQIVAEPFAIILTMLFLRFLLIRKSQNLL